MSYTSSIQKSLGSSRILTHTFKKFRKSGLPRKRFQIEMEISPFRGNEKLLEEIEPSDKIKPAFPPLWVDTYDKITEDLSKLQETMTSLEALQLKKISSPFSSNTESLDSKIRIFSDSVFQQIKNIDSEIKEIKTHEGSNEDRKIRKNIISSLSEKLKSFTLRYKKKQDEYLRKTDGFKPKHDLIEMEKVESSFDTDDYEQSYAMQVKNEAVDALVQNIIDLADIFKELNTLVVTQGTILDRIDYNIQQTLENTKQANTQLQKASDHQKCTRAAGCIMFLIGIIFVLIIILGLKVWL